MHADFDALMLNANGDPIDNPRRYIGRDGTEVIDVMREFLTPEEFRGFCKGNAIKYVLREAKKGKDLDLKKAIDNLTFALEARRDG